jgi:hypothetical protein
LADNQFTEKPEREQLNTNDDEEYPKKKKWPIPYGDTCYQADPRKVDKDNGAYSTKYKST